MRFFKDVFLSCAPYRKKQIAPKNSPSPPVPLTPRKALPAVSEIDTPVKLGWDLSQKREFAQLVPGEEKVNGAKDLRRAASANRATPMGARACRASAFAGSKTMSSNDIRFDFRSDSSKLLQRSTSRGHQPIIFSTSSGLLKVQPVELMLECTLDELCFGCMKQIEVSRDVISNGLMTKEEELLTVSVEPGWKKGTTITFCGREDKETGKYSGDVVLVVVEKEHERFKRRDENEEDLETEIGMPLVDAITGCNLSISLLGEEQMILPIEDTVEPGFEIVIEGQGMPRMKDPFQRGDLKIKFHIEFPKSLTDSQRSEIYEILSGTPNFPLM